MNQLRSTLLIAILFALASVALAQNPGNAYHVPGNTVPNSSDTMRTPLSSIDSGGTVTIYSGNQFQGSGNPGNQTGGALYYKTSGGGWQSVALGFFTQNGNDKYWRASFVAPTSASGIKYYLEVTYSDHNTTFVYGTDATTITTTTRTTAENGAFTFSLTPVLTVNGVSANYTTSHLFVDEIANDSLAVNVVFSPNAVNLDPATVQVFTNLNRRDFATLPYTDGNGIPTEEGISPPNGDVVGTNESHYYKAYAMGASGEQFTAALSAQKTGAYRLTARYRLLNSSTWQYYTSSGRRDHALVVSPKVSREISLYELNTLNIDATGDQFSQRSTFADLHNNAKRWNLNYVKNLGCNFLWFQPIHPNGIDGRQIDPNTSAPFSVGSPYAVKNFFEIMEFMGQSNTRSGAKTEFHDFVVDADAAKVGVMLDAPFNHTSYDSEVAQQGVALFKPGANPTDQIRNSEARVYSRGDLFNFGNNNYCQRASSASNIAPAPDRNDFGKFGDTFDIFFGNYSALVCQNNADNNNYNNENDVFDYSNPQWNGIDFIAGGVSNNITRNVWRFFASYIPYWLTQTGHSGVNSTAADGDAEARLALDSKGIDALRADFGQGLPPQCWEYIINVTRTHKWNFVFMTESLDGGAVTYRSNRHFDILNENIIFPFKAATTTNDYRGIFDSRRSAYGQGLVLLNSTSHDEENYDDPFQALIRYGVSNTVDGAPLVFYGQENGVSRTFGYSHYETNFGKQIPHFKVFNDLGPILGNQTYGLQQLFYVYAGMGQARQSSPALRSSNRYYLNQTDTSVQPSIFSVAKYETPNGSPASTDLVFGFMNLDRNNDQSGNFNVNITQSGSNLFGLKRGRTYDVKNIAAYLGQSPNRRDTFLNRKTGDQLLDNGFFVGMKKVPVSDGEWTTGPFEAQYLKVYDVTAPAAAPGIPTLVRPNAYGYAINNGGVTFSWAPVGPDAEGIQPLYKVTYQLNNNQPGYFFTTSTSNVFQIVPGNTLTVYVQAINPNDVRNASTPTGPSGSVAIFKVITPEGDEDGDGMTNAEEDVAATNPFDPASLFTTTNLVRPDGNNITVTWKSVVGKTYRVDGATAPGGPYVAISGSDVTANSTVTSATVATGSNRFFRVEVDP